MTGARIFKTMCLTFLGFLVSAAICLHALFMQPRLAFRGESNFGIFCLDNTFAHFHIFVYITIFVPIITSYIYAWPRSPVLANNFNEINSVNSELGIILAFFRFFFIHNCGFFPIYSNKFSRRSQPCIYHAAVSKLARSVKFLRSALKTLNLAEHSCVPRHKKL